MNDVINEGIREGDKRGQAKAFLKQAESFYSSAGQPKMASSPLLYYYAFLNIAKAKLLLNGYNVQPSVRHGVSDPKANHRVRLQLEGQGIDVAAFQPGVVTNVFPALVHSLNGLSITENRRYKILDLLSDLPCIHRAYCHVTRSKDTVLPVSEWKILKDNNGTWTTMTIIKKNEIVRKLVSKIKDNRNIRRIFKQVDSGRVDELALFETERKPCRNSGIDKGIRELSKQIKEISPMSMITANGYRTYLSIDVVRNSLPHLAKIYGCMFYFGSITRYKPYDFEKLLDGKYSRLLSEFMATQPTQYLYGIASSMANVDVVRPYSLTL